MHLPNYLFYSDIFQGHTVSKYFGQLTVEMFPFHTQYSLNSQLMLHASLVHKQGMMFALLKVDVLLGGINCIHFLQH